MGAAASLIDLADGDSRTEPCLVLKPAAVRSKHKAPSFSTNPGPRARGLASGDLIKEVSPALRSFELGLLRVQHMLALRRVCGDAPKVTRVAVVGAGSGRCAPGCSQTHKPSVH